MTLTGLLSARLTGLDGGVMAGAFLDVLALCAQMALAPAAMSLLTNTVEVLNKLDVKFPLMRG